MDPRLNFSSYSGNTILNVQATVLIRGWTLIYMLIDKTHIFIRSSFPAYGLHACYWFNVTHRYQLNIHEAWINMDLRDVNWLLVSVCKYLSASPHRVQEPLTQPMKFLFTTVWGGKSVQAPLCASAMTLIMPRMSILYSLNVVSKHSAHPDFQNWY